MPGISTVCEPRAERIGQAVPAPSEGRYLVKRPLLASSNASDERSDARSYVRSVRSLRS